MFNTKRRKTAKAFFAPAQAAALQIRGLQQGDRLDLQQ